MVLKGNAKKIRSLSDGNVLVGFAGSTADALSLVERLETRLEEHPGQLTRACVELAKMWRTDKYLRYLEATLIAADRDVTLILTGTGDVIEPSMNIAGTGSGSAYAIAAARALLDVPGLTALEIAKKAMTIAAEMCVFTNENFTIETLDLTSAFDKDKGSNQKPEAKNITTEKKDKNKDDDDDDD